MNEETRRSYSVYSFYCFVIHLHTNIFKIRLTKQNSGHIRCSLFATIKRTCFPIQISLAAPSLSLSLSLSLFVRLKYYTNSAAFLNLSRPSSGKQSIHNKSFGAPVFDSRSSLASAKNARYSQEGKEEMQVPGSKKR